MHLLTGSDSLVFSKPRLLWLGKIPSTKHIFSSALLMVKRSKTDKAPHMSGKTALILYQV